MNSTTYVLVGSPREVGDWMANYAKLENKQAKAYFVHDAPGLAGLRCVSGPLEVVILHSAHGDGPLAEVCEKALYIAHLANYQVSGYKFNPQAPTDKWAEDGLEFEVSDKFGRVLWCVRREGEYLASGTARYRVGAYFAMRNVRRRYERING